jgi:hypothetical protein
MFPVSLPHAKSRRFSRAAGLKMQQSFHWGPGLGSIGGSKRLVSTKARLGRGFPLGKVWEGKVKMGSYHDV